MSELIHRIKVFVFEAAGPEPRYLLLRSAQGIESLWGPVHGTIGFGEKLEHAIHREVLDDTGLLQPAGVIDLGMPTHWSFGDEDVIEWTYGFQTIAAPPQLRLDPRWAEFRWASFGAAYPTLELDADRAAIMRLHTILRAA
ncbi:MAG: NUDIX domain-containing protein [Planctomycetes bacterium]|nr:NUDIX domain-containing protein [Planctomycetota bacterium]